MPKKDNSEPQIPKIREYHTLDILFLLKIKLTQEGGRMSAKITHFDKVAGQKKAGFMQRLDYIAAIIMSPMACLLALVFVPILFISSMICWLVWIVFATIAGNENPKLHIEIK